MGNIAVCHFHWIGDNPATTIFDHEILNAQCINLIVKLTGDFIVFVKSVFDLAFWLFPFNTSPIYLDSHYEEIVDDVWETVRLLSFHTNNEPDAH